MNMNTISSVEKPSSRFRSLLSGNRQVEIWNTIVYENADFLVAPSLGSIVPNWLLIIPKQPSTCFAERESQGLKGLRETIYATVDELQLSSDKILWFEHGAKNTGTDTGCGVDYAHAHIIFRPVFSFDLFKETVFRSLPANWISADTVNLAPNGFKQQDYLIFGDNEVSYITREVENAGSQFFRRIIANISSLDNQWDYRQYTHKKNIELTLKELRKC